MTNIRIASIYLNYTPFRDISKNILDSLKIIFKDKQVIIDCVEKSLVFGKCNLYLSCGLKIVLVDGDFIKKTISMSFVEGGNDLVYSFIPKRQVWVDARMHSDSLMHIVFHELFERTLMSQGFDYDDAHIVANVFERELIS